MRLLSLNVIQDSSDKESKKHNPVLDITKTQKKLQILVKS